MTYQTTNDFDLTRQDGTYTGATGELVVSDGGTITLPTPTAGEKFGVRALRNDVTLLPNGSIEASTSDRRIDSEGNSVFVSDGTEWYLVSGNEYFGFDIPDSALLLVDAKAIADSFSDGDTVNTWSDQTGNGNDLTAVGGPTFRDSTNDINGNPTVVYDGTNDGHAGPSIAGDVLTVIMVVEPQIDPLGNTETWCSVDDSNFDGQAWTSNDKWEVKAQGAHLGNSDTSPQVHTVVWDAGGSDGLFRQNGVQQSSGDISESVNTFVIGFRASGPDSFGNHAVSLAEVHDTILSTSEIESREQFAADRYGITL